MTWVQAPDTSTYQCPSQDELGNFRCTLTARYVSVDLLQSDCQRMRKAMLVPQ